MHGSHRRDNQQPVLNPYNIDGREEREYVNENKSHILNKQIINGCCQEDFDDDTSVVVRR